MQDPTTEEFVVVLTFTSVGDNLAIEIRKESSHEGIVTEEDARDPELVDKLPAAFALAAKMMAIAQATGLIHSLGPEDNASTH